MISDRADYLTVRGVARRLGLGEKPIRAAIRRGELMVHAIPGTWPRLYWPQVEAWARSKRAPATSHAEARLREVLDREERLRRLRDLTAEAEHRAAPLRGPVTARQRPWSDLLDQIEHERQRVTEGGR
jgi:hypothetical protein